MPQQRHGYAARLRATLNVGPQGTIAEVVETHPIADRGGKRAQRLERQDRVLRPMQASNDAQGGSVWRDAEASTSSFTCFELADAYQGREDRANGQSQWRESAGERRRVGRSPDPGGQWQL